ncbi:fas-binding factor 1 [Sabethes cyaneus]|uniref:fas-binding factor 1 n=1 Tax=Sabethes cyaneus TaxID=53552 RepID=UPI00237DDE87|nr:fas-binding factor 1 [Sabethes cyaneus]
MNFDLDDPLDGLLSDGSNDSLFGNDTGKKSTKIATIASKSETKQTKMEDLFGIKPEGNKSDLVKPTAPATAPTTTEKEHVSLDYSKPSISSGQPSSFPTRKTSTPIKKPEPNPKKEITFDDSDVFSDLGFDPKKPKSKSSVLDDILGGPIITSSKEIVAKQSKSKQSLVVTKEESAGSKTVSRQSTETSENLPTESTMMGGYAPSGGNQRRSARRKSSSALNDPLGLFSAPLDPRKETKTVKKGADWLGLNDDSNSNDPEPAAAVRTEPEPVKAVEVIKPQSPKVEVFSKTPVSQVPTLALPESIPTALPVIVKPNIATTAQTMEILNRETESALSTLQQQDFQVTIANQMKNQEQVLFDLQQKQQAILQKQETQFNELLQKQIYRHNHLEDVIAKQQERINANIQLMMTQPAQFLSLPTEKIDSKQAEITKPSDEKEELFNKVQLESDLKRLEMEKLRLEDLVSNITANHEQEIVLLEQSYRKQMAFLEESLKIMETRMKVENKNLEDYYKAKLQGLEAEKEQLLAEHAKQVQQMEVNHRSAIEKIKSNYEENLENMKSEHREMITNIRESKMMEFSLLQDNHSYVNMLKSASNYLETASGDLQQLKDTLQDRLEFTQKEKEIQLKSREKQLDDQQRLLERTKEAAETEKVRLLNLVEMLELKLADLTKTTSEEHWTYQQKLVKLESEKSSFDKEKEHAREKFAREEKRLDELKQQQLEEHSKLMQKIHDERQLLLEEKAKLETLSKIQKPDSAAELSRAEIDAAIKVAEEAARQSDKERERFLQLQRQFESKRRELISQNSAMQNKSIELENAISSAKAKEQYAEMAFKAVKRAEQNLQLKVQLVQKQFREVSEREDRLAKDKIELSKERLELQSTRKRLQTSRCSLCKISERSQEIGDYLTTAAVHNSDSVADDRKLEANFIEMQHRDAVQLDQFFDSDLDRQLQGFLERNRVDDAEMGAAQAAGLLSNLAENEDGTVDSDLLLQRFSALKSLNFDNVDEL